jgi:hypothetical protein
MPIKHIVIALYLCYLTACASTEQGLSESSSGSQSTGSDCISQGSIRDYTVLDNANLLVTSGANRKFHVELSRAAHNLRINNAIGFQSASGRICDRFSDVLINDGFGVEKIRISSVRRLSAQTEEELLIRFGKIEPTIKQTRPPSDVEGAEVEELD